MLDQETWRFINSFAPWASALGTIAAVVNSLRLANRDRRIHLSVKASLCVYLNNSGGVGHGTRLVALSVTNEGRRPVTIRSFGWHIGLPYLRRFNPFGLARVEFIWNQFSGADLPARLGDGQECVFSHDLELFSVALCDSLAQKKALLPWPYLRFRTMQAIVATTAGRTFYATVSKDLQKELARRAIAKAHNGH